MTTMGHGSLMGEQLGESTNTMGNPARSALNEGDNRLIMQTARCSHLLNNKLWRNFHPWKTSRPLQKKV